MMTKTKMLETFRTQHVEGCERCDLCINRQKIVFARGDANSPVMFIGEAPGEEEDKAGLPFVGNAGQLLNDYLGLIKWSPEMVYVANVVKCRPPANRDPSAQEREACFPFLQTQIAVVAPQVIVTLGNVATRALIGQDLSGITTIRGIWMKYQCIDVMPTLHPSFVLHQPSGKRYLLKDLKAVKSRLKKGGSHAIMASCAKYQAWWSSNDKTAKSWVFPVVVG